MNKPTKLTAHTLDLAIAWIILITIFLLPVFFNPVGSDLFDLSKRLLLGVSVSAIIILWSAKNVLTRSVRITITPFTLPLFLLTAAIIASAISPSLPRSIEAFITTTSTSLFLFILFIAATTSRAASRMSRAMLTAAIGSGLVLAILGILEAIGTGPSLLMNKLTPSLAGDNSLFISPPGSATILIAFLIPSLIAAVLTAFTTKSALERALYLLSSGVIVAAIAIGVFNILPGKPNSPVFLPYSASWEIAAENIKHPKAFLIGVGADNYVAAFSSYHPVTLNLGELWITRFTAARNYPLHLFTTSGLLGLSAWVFILFVLFKTGKQFASLTDTSKIALIALTATVIINLLLPPNPVLTATFVFFITIIASELKNSKGNQTSELILKFFAAKLVRSQTHQEAEEDKKPAKSELLPLVLGIPALLTALVLVFGVYRVAGADLLFQQSLIAAVQNDGTTTYDSQRLAIAANPFLSSYHRTYAATNLAIAGVIGAKEELSDTDRANITTLIQQAIRESKVAVQINPENPANWESLAITYRNLINVAEGAADWSTASYVEAIRRDPQNPSLRLELGGIYYQLQDYQNAIRLFSQAADLKPNWPNAHYNLANAYAGNNELQRAVATYDTVLQLIEPGSKDYQKALDEQNSLKAKLGQQATKPEDQEQTGQLQPPSPLPSPNPQTEPIQLDQSSAPPAGTGTGFSDLTASPTPSPSPTP